MKKIKFLSLVAAMLLSAGNVCAQADKTFCFVDANGNEVANGSTFTVYAVEEEKVPGMPIFGVISQAKFDLSIKNNTNGTAKVALKVVAPENPASGSATICFPIDCNDGIKGEFTSKAYDMAANEIKPLNSEWFFDAGKYSTEKVSLTILGGAFLMAGPTVHINCIYAAPAGIADMESDKNAKVTGRYDANGNKLSAPRKGLNIVKLSNGKTVKTVIK